MTRSLSKMPISLVASGALFLHLHYVEAASGSEISASSAEPNPLHLNESTHSILELLDQYRSIVLPAVSESETEAAQQPPEEADPEELAEFYLHRSRAARLAGRTAQELEDMRKAHKFATDASGKLGWRKYRLFIRFLSYSEMDIGRFDDALELMQRAVSKYRASVWHSQQLSMLYAAIGDLRRARRNFDAVQAMMDQPSRTDPPSVVNAAFSGFWVARAAGRWDRAGGYLQHALENYEYSEDRPWWISKRRLDLVYNLLNRGRVNQAELEAVDLLTETLNDWGRRSRLTAETLAALAVIQLERGDPASGLRLALEAEAILAEVGTPTDSMTSGTTTYTVAKALLRQGDASGAIKRIDDIRTNLKDNMVLFDSIISKDSDFPFFLLAAGRADEALSMSQQAAKFREKIYGDDHYGTQESLALVGLSYAAIGERQKALRALTQAWPILRSGARSGSGKNERVSAGKQWRLRWIFEGMLELLEDVSRGALESKTLDPADVSFEIANFLRLQAAHGAVTKAVARMSIRDESLAKIVRREQDLEQEREDLEGELIELTLLPRKFKDRGREGEVSNAIQELDIERDTLEKKIAKEFPRYDELRNPKPVTLERASAILKPDEVLLVIYPGRKKSYLWALQSDGRLEFRSSDIPLQMLEAKIARLREALDPNASSISEIPVYDLRTAHELYEVLLEPLEDVWATKNHILVVPNEPLGQLPLSVLPTKLVETKETDTRFGEYREVPWLARTHAVSVLPSISSLVQLRSTDQRDSIKTPFIGFGDPVFAETDVDVEAEKRGPQHRESWAGRGADRFDHADLPPLPETATELTRVAQALGADPSKDVYLELAATEENVKSVDLRKAQVVAFATHGLVAGDLEGLDEPALALTSPFVSGGAEDGLLKTSEILSLRLDADWVLLSACNTAAGSGAGEEAISGLGRAFFYAGAYALLLSNWPVYSASTTELMTTLFEDPSYEQQTRSDALRAAMTEMIDQGVYRNTSGAAVFSYAHPIFWAPFSLVGDGGGSP